MKEIRKSNTIAVNWVFNYLLVFKRVLVKECMYKSAIRVNKWTEISQDNGENGEKET